MSYLVGYWVEINPGSENAQKIVNAWNELGEEMLFAYGQAELSESGEIVFFGDEGSNGEMGEEEIRDLAKQFPSALITVTAEGEDFGDWPTRTYYKGEEIQYVGCAFPPFEEA